MKIKSFEFNLRELVGSMGDVGTLFPLAIGYMVVCGLNPAGFLVMMGLANIATGLLLAIEAFKMLSAGWVLGSVSIMIVLVLRRRTAYGHRNQVKRRLHP